MYRRAGGGGALDHAGPGGGFGFWLELGKWTGRCDGAAGAWVAAGGNRGGADTIHQERHTPFRQYQRQNGSDGNCRWRLWGRRWLWEWADTDGDGLPDCFDHSFTLTDQTGILRSYVEQPQSFQIYLDGDNFAIQPKVDLNVKMTADSQLTFYQNVKDTD